MQKKTPAIGRSFPHLGKALFTLSLGALVSAQGSSFTWNGGGADNLWSNAANWNNILPVPATTNDLQFGGSANLFPNNDFSAASFRHITFNSGASPFALTGNSMTLAGNVTNNSASLQTINMPLSVTAVRIVSPGSGGVTFGNSISGAGGLNLATGGRVTLSANNTFKGALTVNDSLTLPENSSVSVAANFIIGNVAGDNGALAISGGAATNTQASGTGNFMIGRAGYGSLNLTSGTVKANTIYIGWTGGTGTALIDGGSFYCGTGNDYVVIGNSTGTGSLTVKSGLFSHAGANRTISLNNNGFGRGEINVLGGTLDSSGNAISFGYNTAFTDVATGAGIVSLDGGNLILNRFINTKQKFTDPGDAGFASVNFNGGTLTLSPSDLTSPNQDFSSDLIPAAMDVRVRGPFGSLPGGATIDTAGEDAVVTSPLLAPTGEGILSIPVTDGGSGYIGAPYLSISGDGQGATAIANMVDDGSGKGTLKIGSITVSNPGFNYTAGATFCSIIGGNPTIAATLGSITTAPNTSGGLTKNGTGTLTLLGANSYSGDTVVNAGRLMISTMHSGSGNILVNDGAAFGITRDSTFTEMTTTNLTVGTSTGAELDFVLPEGNAAAQLITAQTIVLNGATTVRVSGSNFTVGDQFPLIKYTTLVGDPASITNGILIPPDGTLAKLIHNSANSSFDLKITAIVSVVKWNGNVNSGGVGVWDNANTPNWLDGNNASAIFIPGADTTLDDTAAGVTSVSLSGNLSPASVMVNNSSKDYTFGGTGSLVGDMGLTKQGTGKLTIANANSYSGPTTISGGTVEVTGSLNNDGAFTIDSGTLTSSGAINSGTGAWSIGATDSARGVVNLNAGAAVNIANGLILGTNANSSGALNINGGTLTNTQSSIAANLELGTAGYGALNVSSGTVDINTFYIGGGSGIGIATVSGGTVLAGKPGQADYLLVGGIASGTGVLTVNGGTVSHSGANRLLSVNNNSDGRGELNILSGLLDNTGGGIGYGYNAGTGTGTGIVNVNGGNVLLNRFVNTKQGGTLLTGNAYLNLNGGTLTATTNGLFSPNQAFSSNFIPARIEARINGAFGNFAGGAVIDTAGQDVIVDTPLLAPVGSGISSLAVADGGSGYIGAPYVSIIGDGTGASAIANMVSDGNGGLKVGSITVCNPGVNYTSGGSYFTFTGGAPITPATPGTLSTAVNTSGGLKKLGTGTLTLNSANTYTGATLVNGGTLRVDGSLDAASAVTVSGGALSGNGVVNGAVTVQAGGILAPKGTLTINNTLNLVAGSTTLMQVNAGTGASDLAQGITSVTYGGALVLTNTAGTLTAGQTFQLITASANSGNFASVQSLDGGASWSFDPATGVATVLSVTANTPTNISFTLNGTSLSLTWPASHLGWYAQSNSVDVGNPSAWFDIPGSQTGTNLDITIDPGATNVFYRLRQP